MITYGVVSFALLVQGGVADVPDVAEIESKVLANRRAIKSGHVVLDTKVREGPASFETVRTIWFDGERTRCDERKAYAEQPKDATDPYYTSISCFGDDEHLAWSDEIMPDGGTIVLNITDMRQAEVARPYRVINPRMLGMSPLDSSLSLNLHLESFVASANRKDPSATLVTEDGTECWRIEFEMTAGTPGRMARIWVAPDKDYSVTKIEQEFDLDGVNYRDVAELDVEQDEESGIWFPVSSHYQRVESGKDGEQVTREEHLEVTVVSLNQSLDPQVFTAAGMGIPPGTWVVKLPGDYSSSGFAWDGKEVVRHESLTADEELVARRPRSKSFWLFIMLNCVIVGAVCLWYFFRRQRT